MAAEPSVTIEADRIVRSAPLLMAPSLAQAEDPGVAADEGIIAGLESMGFSREHAAAAARATFNVSTENSLSLSFLTQPSETI